MIVKYASTNIIQLKVNAKEAWDVVCKYKPFFQHSFLDLRLSAEFGGFLGFICGASMISLLEVSGFCICLLWKSATHILRNMVGFITQRIVL